MGFQLLRPADAPGAFLANQPSHLLQIVTLTALSSYLSAFGFGYTGRYDHYSQNMPCEVTRAPYLTDFVEGLNSAKAACFRWLEAQ
jgi:hypothetical protein